MFKWDDEEEDYRPSQPGQEESKTTKPPQVPSIEPSAAVPLYDRS